MFPDGAGAGAMRRGLRLLSGYSWLLTFYNSDDVGFVPYVNQDGEYCTTDYQRY